MRALAAVLLLVLTLAGAAEAQTRWESCLASATCRAELAKYVATAIADWQAKNVPCEVFAPSRLAAEALAGTSETVCLVIKDVKKCDGDHCAVWSAP